ncbi:unnamed protein product [Ambrosiozyma monospora]|uniref:Peroxisomal ATPase PEX6 n=1 Tax=Ambrosiozyma monospora TaxID=43982 RepID=A0A9W7DDN9_AMBMO|nr:unnamed protein product [Ambrosiozyma monospora]
MAYCYIPKAKAPFQLNENALGVNQTLDHLQLDFDPFGINSKYSATPQSFEFFTAPLANDTLSSYTHCLNKNPEFKHDDEQLFACISSSGLQQLGCLSGDIVKCTLESNRSFYLRLFPFIDPNTFSSNSVYISPLLLVSLGEPKQMKLTRIKSSHTQASIGSDLMKHKFESFIPLAKEVVIARVACPITLDRTLQHLFLSNLKSHFENRHRIVSLGQFIPIPIDTYLARSLFTTYEGSGSGNGNGSKSKLPPIIPPGKPDDIAWFKITGGSIEVDGNPLQLYPGQQFMIDSTKTRMIQSGAVNDKLPFTAANGEITLNQVQQYLGLPDIFEFPSHITNSGECSFGYARQLRKILLTSSKVRSKGLRLPTTILLTSLSRCVGKSTLVRSIAIETCTNLLELDGFELFNQASANKTIGTIRGKVDGAVQQCGNLILYLKHIDALTKKVDPQQQQKEKLSLKLAELIDEYTNKGVIFIASSNDPDSISEIVRSKMKFEFSVSVPSEMERKMIFQKLIAFDLSAVKTNHKNDFKYLAREDLSLNTLSLQSAGLTPKDLESIVQNAKNIAVDRLEDQAIDHELTLEELIALSGGIVKLSPEDFEKAINDARSKFSDSIGAPRIPDVKWEDVGGLDLVKDEILDTIDMPLKHPELFSSGMKKRSGILFYGPPGTGKTLLAKAIATNFALNFFSVKGPELLNMYIGESEANVRRVFQKARDAKPCVIFFDELDSVAPKRGNQGDSGGVMDRIVSQLLAELDGMSGGTDDGGSSGDGVFVVGATNRPDLLDEALLRPGRFDKMLYLGISDTHEKQAKIIEALTRKFQLDPDVDIGNIAESCPYNFTGADFYALCSDAMLNAMTRIAGVVEEKIKQANSSRKETEKMNSRYWFDNVATEEDVEVVVTAADFQKARSELIASVSENELKHYLDVRRAFEGGKNKAK